MNENVTRNNEKEKKVLFALSNYFCNFKRDPLGVAMRAHAPKIKFFAILGPFYWFESF